MEFSNLSSIDDHNKDVDDFRNELAKGRSVIFNC